MILAPAPLAQLAASAVSAALVAGAAGFALVLLRGWDPASGSRRQLRLERQTYLVSTLLALAFGVQLAGLFLFVHGADAAAGQITGAMCAAGTLAASRWGWPALGLKLAAFVLAGVWLVVNALDNRAEDYPLVRAKNLLLLVLAPLVVAAAALEAAFLAALRPDVVTACCGTIFAAGQETFASRLVGTPLGPMRAGFFGTVGGTVAAGGLVLVRGRGTALLAVLSLAALAVTAASLVAFIGMYVYELPTHHCPFCVLQPEYGRIGYALYLLPLGGAVAGLGAGAVAPARRIPSLATVAPRWGRGLAAASLGFWAALAGLVAWTLLATDFRP